MKAEMERLDALREEAHRRKVYLALAAARGGIALVALRVGPGHCNVVSLVSCVPSFDQGISLYRRGY